MQAQANSISPIVAIVDFCVRRPWSVTILAGVIVVGSGIYAARHFAINSDVHNLISSEVPWAHRALAYMRDFPRPSILVVITAPTPEVADQSAARLAEALRRTEGRFHSVTQPGSGKFFEQNGLLFLATEDVKKITDGLARAEPLIGTLSADQSLRGVLDALSLSLVGVRRGETNLADLAKPISMAADAAEEALAGRAVTFSWRILLSDKPRDERDLRRFLMVDPVLDFSAMQPGGAATEAINNSVAALGLESRPGVSVRQTGDVPIADDEFGSITRNAGLNATATIVAVLVILWMALGSFRTILAVVVSLLVGLVAATAAGLFMVGAFNPISVAFFVLFVGLGVDFGIQFSVRYRSERYDNPDMPVALHSAARKAGGPLALAAAATAVGFSSFVPTAYRGLSELGGIAGLGMIIAFVTSITLLPALIAVLRPGGEARKVGFALLAPLDRAMEQHRTVIIAGTLVAVLAASPLLLFLRFDFDPMHLRSEHLPAVATYLELRRDPLVGANAVDIVKPDLAAARAIAQRVAALPQVAQAKTIADLVPQDQDEKLKLIRAAAAAIEDALNSSEVREPPTDQENVEALTLTAADLAQAAGEAHGSGPDAARRLSDDLTRLATADPAIRRRLEAAIVEPLRASLDQIRNQLKAQLVSIEQMPPELVRDWITPDGRARVEVLPKGDPDDTMFLRNFVEAVLAEEPTATGPAVEIVEAANTIVHAFFQAGAFALLAILVLLWIALRRFGDVLLTLVPLLVAGAVTLELCVLLNLPLNFANIIALPLLLGVGVAFKIYYIVAWRSGKTGLLQSSLTRAVLFSSMTTATAFGSLWFSSHPGTSSMGKLMALALMCTMAAAVLFQPVLMGPPRKQT